MLAPRTRSVLLFSAALAAAPMALGAQTLGLMTTRYQAGIYTYNASNMTYYTNALNTAFGGASNITLLSDLSGPLGFTSLLIEIGNLNGGGSGQTLSPTDVTALQGFIAAGHRVMIEGENSVFSNWDSSFLTAIGGSDCSTPGYSNAPGTTIFANQITAGVHTVVTGGAPGCAAGGQQLFSNTFASMFGGAQQNVLVNMDDNIIDDPRTLSSGADNGVYMTNAAVWLAGGGSTSTPEPATFALLAPALVFVGVTLRGRRRAS